MYRTARALRNGFRRRFTTDTATDVESIKTRLVKSNRMLSFYIGAAAAATIGGIAYQLYDFQPENNISKVVGLLRQGTPETVDEGLKQLNSCFHVSKRVFSGTASVPISSSVVQLHEADLVSSLVNASHQPTLDISWRSLSWLNYLASHSHSIREQIVKTQSVPDLVSVAKNGGDHQEWLLASNILLQIARDEDVSGKLSDAHKSALIAAVDSLGSRSQPLSLIAAAKLSEALHTKTPRAADGLGGKIGNDILDANVRENSAKTFVPLRATAGGNVLSNAAFSLFTAGWAAFWWRTRAVAKGGSNLPEIRDFVKKRSTGFRFFMLLTLDDLMRHALTYSSTTSFAFEWREDEPSPVLGNNAFYQDVVKDVNEYIYNPNFAPMSSVLPIVQTGVFGTLALGLLRANRFVALPLAMAATYNHRDLLCKNETVRDISAAVLDYFPQEWVAPIRHCSKNGGQCLKKN